MKEENNGNSKEYNWSPEMPRGIGHGNDNIVFIDDKAYRKGSNAHMNAIPKSSYEDDMIFGKAWKGLMGVIFFGGISFVLSMIFVS